MLLQGQRPRHGPLWQYWPGPHHGHRWHHWLLTSDCSSLLSSLHCENTLPFLFLFHFSSTYLLILVVLWGICGCLRNGLWSAMYHSCTVALGRGCPWHDLPTRACVVLNGWLNLLHIWPPGTGRGHLQVSFLPRLYSTRLVLLAGQARPPSTREGIRVLVR